jgi:hypothetical protein
MAYKINKTDGSLLTEIVDSTIDQTASDLTLIGKNVSGFGEFINENFIKLLENFAATSSPNNPIAGQLWYDTSQNRLKVYDGAGFRQGSGPIVSGTAPSNLVQGDLWINNAENQLYFYDGIDLKLAGPAYGASQDVSGFTVETIIDSNNSEKIVLKLWVNGILLGIFSRNTIEFTPKVTITDFSGTIKPGFNASTLAGMKFNVTSSKADALVDTLGNLYTSNSFMSTTSNATTTGQIRIQNSTPLILGANQNYEITATTTALAITSNNAGQNYQIKIKNAGGTRDAITVRATTERVGIFNDNPAYTFDVNGDARITGNLTVEGVTSSIESTNLVIEDKNIVIANVAAPTDITADGGGITIKGSTDKTIVYNQSNNRLNISESINLALGKTLQINGVTVISGSALGSGITSAPGITAFGAQTEITVDNLYLNSNRIQSTNNNGDIEIEPNGAGNVVLVGSPKITGLATPTTGTDAANKTYVDNTVNAKSLALSMDVTGLNDIQISNYLQEIAPASNYVLGTQARIHCTRQISTYASTPLTSSTYPSTSGDIVKTYVAVDKVGGSENQPVLEDIAVTLDLGNSTVTVERTTKLFEINIITGVWTYVSTISGPTIT